MTRLFGVALGAWCALAGACGAASPKASRAAPAAPAAQDAGGGDPRAQIDALDRQIAGEMARAHVSPPATESCTGATCATAMSQPFATPAATDPECRPARTDTCTSACTLSTSICSNQQKICDLAKQLVGDDWAANKCESAKASCRAAHDSCCSCVL
jgi:hypothetical protein